MDPRDLLHEAPNVAKIRESDHFSTRYREFLAPLRVIAAAMNEGSSHFPKDL